MYSSLMNTYKRNPIEFTRGVGAILFDSSGKRYIDLLAGIAVCSLGHANKLIAEAIAAQAHTLMHVSNLYGTRPMALLADELIKTTGGWGKVFFCNSGAEANECAIKLARKAGKGKRHTIVAAHGGFHGRTLATLAATGQPEKWKGFEPLPQGFVHAEYNNLESFKQALDETTAGILVEPIQGERGVIPATPEFLQGLRELADRAGIALIFDEVQTGVGRTGSWWAFQHYGVKPDILTSAKAIANGLPLGACIAQDAYASAFSPGDHGTTFGGGPVVCAAACSVLKQITELNLLTQTTEKGEYLASLLQDIPEVSHVRGVGLMRGAVLSEPIAVSVVSEALQRGLIINATGESVLRLVPPLVITTAELKEAVDIIRESISKVKEHANQKTSSADSAH